MVWMYGPGGWSVAPAHIREWLFNAQASLHIISPWAQGHSQNVTNLTDGVNDFHITIERDAEGVIVSQELFAHDDFGSYWDLAVSRIAPTEPGTYGGRVRVHDIP